MSVPSNQELEGAILDILSRARNDDRLSQLTVRLIRQELATHFDLEEGVLSGGTYKSFIKETVHATVIKFQNALDEGTELPPRDASKKENSGGKAKTKAKTRPHTRKSKAQVKSDEEPPEEADVSEHGVLPSKKATARSKPSKPVKARKESKKPESEIKFKSKAIIESSDEGGVPESSAQKPSRSPKKEKPPAKPSPKQKQQHKVNRNDSDIAMDIGDGPGPSCASPKAKPVTKPPKAKELAKDPMESELSSVIDEPPKKRQKKQEKESTKLRKDEKAKRAKKEALSKDEETVNKLKGIVVACGVRKVWKKEFEGLVKPSQQIKQLHSILGDLGMMPRYSLEKAKAIRDQRELAQELKDVQEFEKAVKRHGKGLHKSSETQESADDDDDDDDDDANVPAQKKQNNARASIMAFLQDQSEEE